MGQKVNPRIFRIGINKTWDSKWFSDKNYSTLLRQDVLIRKHIKNKLKDAAVDKIEIERPAGNINITIYSGKPGMIIGRAGAGIEELKKEIQNKFLGKKFSLNLNIQEITKPDLSAQIVLQSMIADIEKRIPFRRVMKQALSRIERAGALGARVVVAGRLNGAEIARTEKLSWGKIPLHTLRADIDYARSFARTIFGTIGIKVWINRGEVFNKKESK